MMDILRQITFPKPIVEVECSRTMLEAISKSIGYISEQDTLPATQRNIRSNEDSSDGRNNRLSVLFLSSSGKQLIIVMSGMIDYFYHPRVILVFCYFWEESPNY